MQSKRALSAKEKGRKGGLATARNHDQEFLENRARLAGTSTLNKYGTGFFRHLRTLKGKNKTPTEKVIRTIIPELIPLPENSLQLMQAAAKVIS